jgi:hypothetical protein
MEKHSLLSNKFIYITVFFFLTFLLCITPHPNRLEISVVKGIILMILLQHNNKGSK